MNHTVTSLAVERVKRSIKSVDYMNGLDIEFTDEDTKKRFILETYVIKHHPNGKKSRKIPTAKLLLIFPPEPLKILTIRSPITEIDVIALEIVNEKGQQIILHKF